MKISSDPITQIQFNRKASAFASRVSKTLRDSNFVVLYSSEDSGNDGIRVTALEDSFSGLPTAKVRFNYMNLTGQRFIDFRDSVVSTLRKKFWVVSSGYDSVVVTPRFVNFVSVKSSDPAVPDYVVRCENGIPMLCSCKGFTYRLTCRHLAEAGTNNV